jgi:hypothetical protein
MQAAQAEEAEIHAVIAKLVQGGRSHDLFLFVQAPAG